jgi:hypothetical protein
LEQQVKETTVAWVQMSEVLQVVLLAVVVLVVLVEIPQHRLVVLAVLDLTHQHFVAKLPIPQGMLAVAAVLVEVAHRVQVVQVAVAMLPIWVLVLLELQILVVVVVVLVVHRAVQAVQESS